MSEPIRTPETTVELYRHRLLNRYQIQYVRGKEIGFTWGAGGVIVFVLVPLIAAWRDWSDFHAGSVMAALSIVWMFVLLKLNCSANEHEEYRRALRLIGELIAEKISREEAEKLHAELVSGCHAIDCGAVPLAWEVLVAKRIVPRLTPLLTNFDRINDKFWES